MRFAAPRTVCSVGLALLLAGIACGGGTDPSPTPPEDPPPLATTGSVQVVLRTTGLGLDADGYAVRLDEGVPQPLAANGALTFAEVAPGNHTVRLSGAADNCAPAPPDTTVTVTAGVVSVVDRAVACHIDLRGRLLVSTEQFGLPQLVAMYPDGSQRYRLFTDGFSNAVPTVSPDGTWLLFASYRSGWWRVARFETATGAITVFPKIGDMNLQPALSPDGSQIAFTVLTFESTGEHSRIWVMGADGASPTALTFGPPSEPSDFEPTWSPDGQWIVFNRNGTLYQIRPDGTGLAEANLCLDGFCGQPAWSPDGHRMAYSAGGDIWVKDLDLNTVQQLTTSPDQEDTPRWSPDGTMLAYQRVIQERIQVFRILADGTGAINLSNASVSEAWPAWGPLP
jgi:dipeptidyl aminopeptidase/acylaminoacyl peptidase